MASLTRNYGELLAGGVATFLQGLGLASWDEFGEGAPYSAATEWPVYLGPQVPTSPHRLIVLTPVSQSFRRADIVTTIQVRLRGLPDDTSRDVRDRAQAIHDVFYPNGFPLAHVALGPILIGAVLPGDTLPVSPDTGRRHGHIQSFRFRGRRTTGGIPIESGYGSGGYGE